MKINRKRPEFNFFLRFSCEFVAKFELVRTFVFMICLI